MFDLSLFRLPLPKQSLREGLSFIFRQSAAKLLAMAFGEQLCHLTFGNSAVVSNMVVEGWATVGTCCSKSPYCKAYIVAY